MENVKRILIIDDDEDDQLLIEERLSAMTRDDCEFVKCFKKNDAVNYLRNYQFDLCILDHQLPGYQGLDVLSAVQKDQISTPIVMLTGQNDEKIARQAIRAGAQDFVMKSAIDDEIFVKSIRYAISRKELEYARVISNKVQADNIAKDKFIAHLSHELRTPLTSILGYTSLLLENKDATALHKELSIILNNGKHLLNLLNDVLDLSKIVAAKFELRPQLTDLQQLMVEVHSLLSVSAIDKGLGIEFISDTPLPKMIVIDDLRFKQVLVNIIGNAIKFTDAGKVTVTLSLCEKADPMVSDNLQIEIKDTGIGMDDEQIAFIYTPFHQVEDVTNRKAGGAGLGLSITAEIVKQMDGNLDVTSKLKEGTCFVLTLPVVFAEQKFIEYNFDYIRQNIISEVLPRFEGRVLVVDDVFEIRQLLGYFTTQTGLQVEYAKHGQQALEKINQAKEPFDIVLIDLHMPVMNGRDTVKALRALHHLNMANTALVAMTAATQQGLEQELLLSGFDALISKPIDKPRLWELFSNHLSAVSAQKSSSQPDTHALPISDDRLTQPQQFNEPGKVSKHEKLVHLIEDDVDSAQIMKILINALGFSVVYSSSGKEALAVIANNHDISIHLLDLGLPDISGEALLSKVCSQNYSGKIIVLSGSTPEKQLLERYPIEKYLVKPISKDELEKALSGVS